MIASIRGTLQASGPDHVVVEANGIGYLIFVPRSTLATLDSSSEVRLHTYLVVREDSLTLYGFSSVEQRSLFETLLSVSGVGPKIGLALLSQSPTDDLRNAIAAGDTTKLARTPGVGKKMAERLVLELRSKVNVRGGPLPAGSSTPAQISTNGELMDLLMSLGFSMAEANAAINALPADAPADLDARLRLALRYFGTP